MLLTLLSDLGTQDGAVATTKALLRAGNETMEIVDLSHTVSRHNWREAAYMLAATYKSFPAGTVHIVAVAVFTDENPRMLIVEKDGHFFIAPDNGLLPLVLGHDSTEVVRIAGTYSKPYDFNGWVKDIALLLQKPLLVAMNGMPDAGNTILVHPALPAPQATPFNIVCRVLYADRYSNIVVNFSRADFDKMIGTTPFKIKTFRGQNITTISVQYSDVAVGEALCRFNKAGYLEIAVNHGSALELFGISPGDTTAMEYHTVRIYFA